MLHYLKHNEENFEIIINLNGEEIFRNENKKGDFINDNKRCIRI